MIAKVLRGAGFLLLLTVAILGATNFVAQLIFHVADQAAVDWQMGFSYDTPYRGRQEVFVFTDVTKEKPMDVAGLRKGDRVRLQAVDTLYRLIILNQNSDIFIPIERNGELLDIQVYVPELWVPFPPSWLFWARESLAVNTGVKMAPATR